MNIKILQNCIGFLAPDLYENIFRKELAYKGAKIVFEHGKLIFVEKPLNSDLKIFWSAAQWKDIHSMRCESVKKCAQELRKINKYWSFYSPTNFLRSKLISENLPNFKCQNLIFPLTTPLPQFGYCTLIDKELLLYSSNASQGFPKNLPIFEENKTHPPNRAYLKLWDAFTLMKKYPKQNDLVIELGASPGGWTWVLQQFGTQILSCDRQPLDPSLMNYDKLQFIQQDAFKVLPHSYAKQAPIDWLLSDLICYPKKLYDFVQIWIASEKVNNIVCTIKLQGEMDFEIIEQFSQIQNSIITHLPSNKHELTFLWSKDKLSNEKQ